MASAELLKSMGWSIVVNPVSGQLYIYRIGTPGEMTIDVNADGYEFNIYAHADKLVASASATFEQLECEE